MRLFQLLQLLDQDIVAERCKLHLAGWNGVEDPLDVYLAGWFDEWQIWQNQRNFQRDYVISLIQMPQGSRWLFAGAHESHGSKLDNRRQQYRYHLIRRSATDELDGRLIVHFERPGRQPYLRGERWAESLRVLEMREEKLKIAEFPGFQWAMLSKQELDLIVEQEIPSWKAALSSVAGVYVITDRRTGNLYVGSATGDGGIWGRWCDYSVKGHGGNRDLRDLLSREGEEYAENFQFSILEIADTHTGANEILTRESYWKQVLLSCEHGHNAN